MREPSCDECNGACCRTFWIPRQIAEAWKDRDFIATRSIDMIDVAGQTFRVLPAACPSLTLEGRCSIHNFRPWACKEYQIGGPMCLASIQLSNPRYWQELQKP